MSTAPTSLRAAVVGAGLMGRWHADAVHRCGGRVVAVVDQDAARARALAGRLPSRPAIESDLGRALREHGIQVLHVCTPLETHEALVTQALESGVHVLVEKPLAANAPAVERLHALAGSRGVLACPVHQFLFQPGILSAQRALSGLGAIRHLEVVACSAGADGFSDQGREAVAIDILPHGLALAARLLGATLAEAPWQVGGGPPGELRATADAGATSVMLAVSMRARPTENSLVARCDLGTIRANLFHGYATIERGTPSRMDKVGRPFVASALTLGAALQNLTGRLARGESAYPGLRELVRRFHLACVGQGSSPITVAESLDVARARDTIVALRRRAHG
ncbi:MAG TPA: Gfo/Idh/MocA family oxidoreductase [Gemmatimonadaceae bacterium]|nr:Gfo/Idh/MocA family oxidoreductase [Gemmatimonadaceae bacterium]